MEVFIIRGGSLRHIEELMKFYVTDERETLPSPSYSDLKYALEKQSLLTARMEDGEFAASAGYFEYARSSATHMIYELAGTRVKNSIGRLKGISLQQILIALRVMQIAATEEGPVSLISSAKSPRSVENLQILGFEPIDPIPGWFAFDTCSWTRPPERTKWKHVVATERTIDKSIEILEAINFFKGRFACVASKRQADGTFTERPIELAFTMTWVRQFPYLVAAHRRAGFRDLFVPLPSML